MRQRGYGSSFSCASYRLGKRLPPGRGSTRKHSAFGKPGGADCAGLLLLLGNYRIGRVDVDNQVVESRNAGGKEWRTMLDGGES